jgi:GNAT superfamily N-acetyltransferase
VPQLEFGARLASIIESEVLLKVLAVWNIETLASQTGRDTFDCGDAELNEWLQKYARQSGRAGNTLTRVALDPVDGRIVGYYAQKSYQLEGEELRRAFPGARRYPSPAVLIARLARCRSVAGEGVGELLLAHALRACSRVSGEVGVELVVVHALNERAYAFYSKYGFTPFADHPLHLFMPMKQVRRLYAVDE